MSGRETKTKLAYSIKEACQASSLGKTSIYKHIKNGRLIAVRIGGRTVIPARSLHGLLGLLNESCLHTQGDAQ